LKGTEAERGAAVAAVVLAAGASSRMGRPKQLLDLGGRSLVRHAAQCAAAAACRPVVVVIGAQAELVKAELAGLGVWIVENPAWRAGLSSSIACGIRALPDSVGAAILVPCDQPALSPALLEALQQTQRDTGKPIVACRYGEVLGAPVLFRREWFSGLLRLAGDSGARALVAEAGADVAIVEFPDGAFDVDTPEDWARWQARRGD
jgi:molybdenum cofactor cytidylyltransferase